MLNNKNESYDNSDKINALLNNCKFHYYWEKNSNSGGWQYPKSFSKIHVQNLIQKINTKCLDLKEKKLDNNFLNNFNEFESYLSSLHDKDDNYFLVISSQLWEALTNIVNPPTNKFLNWLIEPFLPLNWYESNSLSIVDKKFETEQEAWFQALKILERVLQRRGDKIYLNFPKQTKLLDLLAIAENDKEGKITPKFIQNLRKIETDYSEVIQELFGDIVWSKRNHCWRVCVNRVKLSALEVEYVHDLNKKLEKSENLKNQLDVNNISTNDTFKNSQTFFANPLKEEILLKPDSQPFETNQIKKEILDKISSNDPFTQNYLETLIGTPKYSARLGELTKFEEETLDKFMDPITSELIDIPVKLNEKLYDLKTLLQLLEKGNGQANDPMTRLEFKYNNIHSAFAENNELKDIVAKILIERKTLECNQKSKESLVPKLT